MLLSGHYFHIRDQSCPSVWARSVRQCLTRGSGNLMLSTLTWSTRGTHRRLGSTMSEAMMSMMASSDRELEHTGAQASLAHTHTHREGGWEEDPGQGCSDLKAGESSRLVMPVQFISSVWNSHSTVRTQIIIERWHHGIMFLCFPDVNIISKGFYLTLSPSHFAVNVCTSCPAVGFKLMWSYFRLDSIRRFKQAPLLFMIKVTSNTSF